MNPFRRLFIVALNRLGFSALCRWKQRNDCVVLVYHGVVRPGQEEREDLERKFVLEDEFKAHMLFIKRHYNPITLEQFLASLEGAPLPPRPLLVTFDDGYAHTMTHVAPHMKALGIPGVIFVVTGLVGTDQTPWPNLVEAWWQEQQPLFAAGLPRPEDLPADLSSIKAYLKSLPETERAAAFERWTGGKTLSLRPGHPFRMMTWDEARELEKNGIAVESHTVTHAILVRCDPQRVRWELASSRETLEKELGRPVHSFAYPNGGRDFFTRHDESLLKDVGYRAAFSMIVGRHRKGDPCFQIRRVPIARNEGWPELFEARMAFPYRLKKRLMGNREELAPGYR